MLARSTDAPIGEHRHAPHIILELRRLQIDAALAEDDRDLALIVEAVAAIGIDELAVLADEFAIELPEAPKAALANFLRRIALERLAAHFLGHRRGVVAEIAAGAS